MRRGTVIIPEPATPPDTIRGSEAPSRRETLVTEFSFLLPRGYVDRAGTVHRDGVMRLATARDELVPLRDDRVRENPAYLTVVLLARVIERIGTIDDIHPGIVEDLFATDLAFLQDLYRRVNTEGHTRATVTCPACEHHFAVDVSGGRLGGILTYATERLYAEIAYVAYYLHWSRDEILDLEHAERQRFVREVGALNTRISGD